MTEPNSAPPARRHRPDRRRALRRAPHRLWFLQVAGGESSRWPRSASATSSCRCPRCAARISTATARVLAQTVPVTSLVVDRQQLSSSTSARSSRPTSPRCWAHDTRRHRPSSSTTRNYAAFEPVPVAKNVDLDDRRLRHRAPRPSSREMSVTTHRRASLPARLPGRRHPRLPRARSTPRSSTRTRATATRPPTPSGRPASSRCSSPSCAGRRARTRWRSTTRAAPSTSSTVTQPEAGPRRAAHHRPADAAHRRGVAHPGHGGCAHARRPQTTATTTRPTRARWWCSTPRTGAVVAMASNPSFDPNDFITGDADQYFKDPDNSAAASTARSTPYAPGSTFKLITSLAMLQSDPVPGDGPNTT